MRAEEILGQSSICLAEAQAIALATAVDPTQYVGSMIRDWSEKWVTGYWQGVLTTLRQDAQAYLPCSPIPWQPPISRWVRPAPGEPAGSEAVLQWISDVSPQFHPMALYRFFKTWEDRKAAGDVPGLVDLCVAGPSKWLTDFETLLKTMLGNMAQGPKPLVAGPDQHVCRGPFGPTIADNAPIANDTLFSQLTVWQVKQLFGLK